MRFPVVLLDLDGTVVDSGPIILASMRYATLSVLAREIPDAELMASVGGPGLEAQMRSFGPDDVDELVRVYREHNEPLHEELEAFAGMADALLRLKDEGRKLGIVSAKRHRTVELAFARVPLGHLFDVIIGGDETERQKPSPDPLLLALQRLDAKPSEAAYIGDSPYDMTAARAAGVYAVGVSWGGIHDGASLVDADVVVHSAEELLAVL